MKMERRAFKSFGFYCEGDGGARRICGDPPS
jgi:hypothetical protein